MPIIEILLCQICKDSYIHNFNTLVEELEKKIGMDLNNKKKRCVRIDGETESEEIFTLLNKVNRDEEDLIDNLMSNSDIEFVLEKKFIK